MGFSCHYQHIFTTAAKMTVFICHRDYFRFFFYFGSMFIYYILCANSLQAIVHICSYTATLHDSQMHTDRKVCAYPADRRGKYLDV